MSDLRSMHVLELVLGALYLAGVQQASSPALRHSSGQSSSSGLPALISLCCSSTEGYLGRFSLPQWLVNGGRRWKNTAQVRDWWLQTIFICFRVFWGTLGNKDKFYACPEKVLKRIFLSVMLEEIELLCYLICSRINTFWLPGHPLKCWTDQLWHSRDGRGQGGCGTEISTAGKALLSPFKLSALRQRDQSVAIRRESIPKVLRIRGLSASRHWLCVLLEEGLDLDSTICHLAGSGLEPGGVPVLELMFPASRRKHRGLDITQSLLPSLGHRKGGPVWSMVGLFHHKYQQEFLLSPQYYFSR